MRAALKPTAFRFPFLLAFALLLATCEAGGDTPITEIPLVPLEYVTSVGGAAPWRAPLHVKDSRLQLAEYGPAGERSMQSYDEVTFPTDVLVVYSEAAGSIFVFLRRSPHGGCLLLWEPETSRIHDPCFGSSFDRDGGYLSGPASRSLDSLPASLRDGMVWVGSEVIYGDPRP